MQWGLYVEECGQRAEKQLSELPAWGLEELRSRFRETGCLREEETEGQRERRCLEKEGGEREKTMENKEQLERRRDFSAGKRVPSHPM